VSDNGANLAAPAKRRVCLRAIPSPRTLSLHGEEVMVLTLVDAPGGNLKPQTTQQSLIGLDT
jgi:hypothetical protein